MRKFIYVTAIFFTLAAFIFSTTRIFAEDTSQISNIQECKNNNISVADCPKYLEDKVISLQGQEKTLSSQISIMNNQVRLTEARIDETEEKISNLEKDIEIAKSKVDNLQEDITNSTKALLGRINATYQVGTTNPWEMFLTSGSIENFFTRLKYLRIVQAYDKKTIYAAEQAKTDYENQKVIFEDKQAEAEALNKQFISYTNQLVQEKKNKQRLLSETQGSEANYQNLLSAARAEYDLIQGIISGKGTETEIGHIDEGQKIASIIPSKSCNSSGPHLHFIVKSGGAVQNPFSYLKPVDHNNESGGDTFNPSGDWNWPIDPPIQLNQGYGSGTWYISTYAPYTFHDGIDISGPSYSVKAVKTGILYRGSFTGKNGCTLPYMRVKHEDGKETLYLHVYSAF